MCYSQIINAACPTRQCGFRLRHFAATIKCRLVGVVLAVYAYNIRAPQVYVPNDFRPCFKIICTLGNYPLCFRPIIALAPYFRCEKVGPSIKSMFTLFNLSSDKRSVGAKKLTMRKVYDKSRIVSICSSYAYSIL